MYVKFVYSMLMYMSFKVLLEISHWSLKRLCLMCFFEKQTCFLIDKARRNVVLYKSVLVKGERYYAL